MANGEWRVANGKTLNRGRLIIHHLRYSPFAIRYSLFAIRHSPFAP